MFSRTTTRVRTHTHTCMDTHTHAHMPAQHIYTHTRMHAHAQTHAQTHTHTHTHICTHTYAHMQGHTHTIQLTTTVNSKLHDVRTMCRMRTAVCTVVLMMWTKIHLLLWQRHLILGHTSTLSIPLDIKLLVEWWEMSSKGQQGVTYVHWMLLTAHFTCNKLSYTLNQLW